MNIKKYTKLWYGDEVKNSITGRQGIIAKFMGFGDGLSLLLKGDRTAQDDSDVAQWELVKKANPNDNGKPFVHLRNIHQRDYDSTKELVEKANAKIYPGAISVSTLPRKSGSYGSNGGLFDRDGGSIWYNCSVEELSIFLKMEALVDREQQYDMVRMTKAEILALPAGEKYFMLYLSNESSMWVACDVIECIKIANRTPTTLLTWNEVRDTNMDECKQEINLIVADGSFIPSHDDRNETGYFYKPVIKEQAESTAE